MEVLAKSKGGRVTDRLEEAGGNAVSRRTETSYKAERLGEAAQHVEAQDSSRTVNDAVVQLQFTFLSGETCPTERSPQCIDTPAISAGPASYSAKESADDGNIAGDQTDLLAKQAAPEPMQKPPLRCAECGGEMQLVAITDGSGRLLYNHSLPYLDSG